MGWLPEWFHVSAEFAYALVAFLGSIFVLQLERWQDRRAVRRQRDVAEWEKFQELAVSAIAEFNRVINHHQQGYRSEVTNSLASFSAIQHRFGILMIITNQPLLHSSCSGAMKTCEEFVESCRRSDATIDIERFSERFLRMLRVSAALMIEMNLPMRKKLIRSIHQGIGKIKRRPSDTITVSKNGDTPPA